MDIQSKIPLRLASCGKNIKFASGKMKFLTFILIIIYKTLIFNFIRLNYASLF